MANPRPGQGKSADQTAAAGPQASVTAKALALLGTFDSEHTCQSLSAMARRAFLPIATAHRLASELVAWGALDRVNANYVVGHRIWQLGRLAPVQQNVAEIAAPYMQDVLFVTQNVVNLFILDGERALLLERISGTRAGSPFRRIGARMSLNASAAGKVMLAFGPAGVLESIAGRLQAETSRTITDPKRLEAEVAEVRARGYATTNEESGPDNFGLAVPILLPDGALAAVLGVVAQGGPPPVGTVVPVLRIAARSIARRLYSGGIGY